MSPTRKQNNKQNKQNKQKKQRGGGVFDFFDKLAVDLKQTLGIKPSAAASEPPAPEPPAPPVEQADGSKSTTFMSFLDGLNPLKPSTKPAETKPPLIGGKKKQNKTKKARVTKK